MLRGAARKRQGHAYSVRVVLCLLIAVAFASAAAAATVTAAVAVTARFRARGQVVTLTAAVVFVGSILPALPQLLRRLFGQARVNLRVSRKCRRVAAKQHPQATPNALGRRLVCLLSLGGLFLTLGGLVVLVLVVVFASIAALRPPRPLLLPLLLLLPLELLLLLLLFVCNLAQVDSESLQMAIGGVEKRPQTLLHVGVDPRVL